MARRRLTVDEAATVLGISTDAVRKRARRGTLESVKGEDGTVFIWLGDGPPDGAPDGLPPTREHLDSLEDQISFLRAELVKRDQELAEMRRLLAGALERIQPQLEAAPEDSGKGDASKEPSERRSWLYRFFFGP